jgi:hypothetical protein
METLLESRNQGVEHNSLTDQTVWSLLDLLLSSQQRQALLWEYEVLSVDSQMKDHRRFLTASWTSPQNPLLFGMSVIMWLSCTLANGVPQPTVGHFD